MSAQTRAFISGRSKGAWHGDLYTQTGERGTAGKKEVGRNTGGYVGVCLIGVLSPTLMNPSIHHSFLIIPTPDV